MAKRDYIEGTGNIFADLGIQNAEEALAKAELAQTIGDILQARRLTQAQAALVLGIDQPKVSALLCGRLTRFSIEKMLQFLLLLGKDIAITIKPRQRGRSRSSTRSPRRNATPPGRGRLTVVDSVPAKATANKAIAKL